MLRDKHKGNLFTACVASGMKVARTCYRLLCRTWEPVAVVLRERSKWKSHEDLSTNTRHRDGISRSSVEGSVMELKRRGNIVQFYK